MSEDRNDHRLSNLLRIGQVQICTPQGPGRREVHFVISKQDYGLFQPLSTVHAQQDH